MYTCICAGVTEPEVRACIHAGADSVEEIGDRCLAGTGCGTCVERLEELLEENRAASTTPSCPLSSGV
ncbi:(2Fe-2S)-binding protein [Actinopolyspora saharensis]|uniref:Bacterioferritin-associated ferredoxin n=1 Tax=Actinopolyspora saharensis TaxID=995062 RepID=A0A1H0ZC92_9ACTN|nr:(2Fe-2S)-binding protein [Actinopolyspora saharensis]SDQ25024.1 bacterioferritin-associated ferredoxin [Actinopolyspora saharensis]